MRHAAYVFDAYGTLFDVHAAVRRHADEAGPDGSLLSEIWRAKQLEYSWLRSAMGRFADFETVTREALVYAALTVRPAVDGSGVYEEYRRRTSSSGTPRSSRMRRGNRLTR